MNTPVVHGEAAEGAPGIVVTNEVTTTEGEISCVQELADAAWRGGRGGTGYWPLH